MSVFNRQKCFHRLVVITVGQAGRGSKRLGRPHAKAGTKKGSAVGASIAAVGAAAARLVFRRKTRQLGRRARRPLGAPSASSSVRESPAARSAGTFLAREGWRRWK